MIKLRKFGVMASVILTAIILFPEMIWGMSSRETVKNNVPYNIVIRLQDAENEIYKGHIAISIAKIADIENGRYEVLEELSYAGVDLNKIQSANELEQAANIFMKIIEPDQILMTDEDGVAKASNLSSGVYLIYADGIIPFLTSVPMDSEEANEELYEIEVFPKFSDPVEITEEPPPKTEDNSSLEAYLLICMIFMLFIGGFFLTRYGIRYRMGL